MKDVHYHHNPGNACALACYTMAAQYLLPNENITFEKLGKIADWHPGYVVWGFRAWKWMMDCGLFMINYDIIDYEAWAEDGISGFRKFHNAEELEYYETNTFDLEHESQLVPLMYDHPNFTYVRKQITFDDVIREHNLPGVCDVTLNMSVLYNLEGFVGHRVILLDITDSHVIFHDPNRDGSGKERKESRELFEKAFYDPDGRELVRYSLGN